MNDLDKALNVLSDNNSAIIDGYTNEYPESVKDSAFRKAWIDLRLTSDDGRTPQADGTQSKNWSCDMNTLTKEYTIWANVPNARRHVWRDMLVARQRQINAEGFMIKHDDEHNCEPLAIAAACYTSLAGKFCNSDMTHY